MFHGKKNIQFVERNGEIEAIVIATGVHTFFGKAAHLVENTIHVGHFQKVHLHKLLSP